MPADPNRVETIFAAALALASSERVAFLAAECGDDAELRERVGRLLAAHDELAAPPGTASLAPDGGTATFGEGEPATADHEPRPDAGTLLAGKYKLVEEVGEGGMGSVWMAQQTEPVKRLVAVKLIKPGMDSRAVLARFEAERQALALMDHPNIAKVLDAGAAPDGRPFFVMELVKGVPITQFCDEGKLTPRERLELFVPVCNAIQHAHQKGVIHRDIKPSNVLVALYDDRPVPKVIDFGVAKAAGQPLTEKTLATGFGAVVGTPEYMSPEQASFNNLDIDTRSDVYALGALLYELLAGSPPFSRKELERAGLLEILRVIREQEPPRPSTKLSTADALPTLSANRGTEPARLTRLLRGELDWIVMKALEKDRNRRYETANGFAADVLRYLAGEQVQAVPPSAGYRLRKILRKHRAATGAAAAVALALLVGTVTSVAFALRAEEHASGEARARKDADDNAAAEKSARQDADRSAKVATENANAAAAARDRVRGLLYDANMNLAQLAFADQRVGRLRELLAELRPAPGEADYRGFEWHHLNRVVANEPFFQVSGPHAQAPHLQTFSPDGRWAVSVVTHQGRRGTFPGKHFETFVDGRGKVEHKVRLEPRPTVDFEVELYDTRAGQVAFRYMLPVRDEKWPGVELISNTGRVAVRVNEQVTDTSTWRSTLQTSRTVTIFDPTGKPVEAFDLEEGTTSLHWDPAGTRFVTTHNVPNKDRVPFGPVPLKMWDAATRKELFSFPQPEGVAVLRTVAFTADGRRVATQLAAAINGGITVAPTLAGQATDPIIVRDSVTGKAMGEVRNAGTFIGFAGPEHHILTVASGDRIGRALNTPGGAAPHAFVLWDPTTGERVRGVPVSLDRAEAFAVSPNGRFAAVGRSNGSATIYDLTDRLPPQDVWGPESPVRHLAFAEGNVLFSLHRDGGVRRYDPARSGVHAFPGRMPNPEGAGLSADGTRLMTQRMGSGGGVVVSDVLTGREVAWLPVGEADEGVAVMEVAAPIQIASQLNRDGTRLLVHSIHDPTLPFRSRGGRPFGGGEYYPEPGAASPLPPAVPASAGDLAAAAWWVALKAPAVERVRVWDVDARRVVLDRSRPILPGHSGYRPTLSPDGRHVLLTDRGGWAVYDVEGGAERCGERPSNPQTAAIGQLVFAGSHLLQVKKAGWLPRPPDSDPDSDSVDPPAARLELRWWDLATGKPGEVQAIPLRRGDPESEFGFQVSADCRRLLLFRNGANSQGQLYALSPAGPRPLSFPPDGVKKSPGSFSFADNGRWLTLRTQSGLSMWNLDEPGPPVQLSGLRGLPKLCAFSPDGRRLVAVSGAARVWDLRTGRELVSLPVPVSAWTVRFAGNRLVVAGWRGGASLACLLGESPPPKW